MPNSLKVSMPVKGFVDMGNPFSDNAAPIKYRFFCNVKDVPSELLDWMSTNPREQNLGSPVAKAITRSLHEDNREFHLRNRGILLSAREVLFDGDASEGTAIVVMDTDNLHGNIDGGHTLRLILQAQEDDNLPEQYVEFEVIVGLDTALDIAEARNTSVALDMRTLEEMKGSYSVLKTILEDVVIEGDRFFDRVEVKMNQQLEEKNAIDIRMIISVILMFNRELYDDDNQPLQMYGGKEAALKKYLQLGGDADARDSILLKMAPIIPDIFRLWDVIERELPFVNERQYKSLRTSTKTTFSRTLFSNTQQTYDVPQALMYPLVAAFRALVCVDEDGRYSWAYNPFEMWTAERKGLVDSLLNYLKSCRGNVNSLVRQNPCWRTLHLSIKLALACVQKHLH